MASTKPGKTEAPLTQRQIVWLCAAALAALLPLLPEQPFWLGALCVLAIVWRGWLLWRRVPAPPGWLVTALAVAGAIGIGVYFRTVLGMVAGVALLALFIALKLFETRQRRDAMVVVLLAFFLLLAQFFNSQTMLDAVIMFGTTLLLTGAMVILQKEDLPLRVALAVSARMLAYALPIMLLLFLLMPRIPGPLWGLPDDAYAAKSGLPEAMAPGSISQLAQSQAIAFRVRFDGATPPRDQLYWRGPVLQRFDGRNWQMSAPRVLNELPYAQRGPRFDYEITLEPSNRHWLLGLDFPAAIPAEGLLSTQYQLVSREPLRERKRFRLSAWPQARPGLELGASEREQALRLPPGRNPRSAAYAQTLRQRYRNDADVAAAMLTDIRQQAFVYTLNPPLLGDDSVDQFLFETRRGFCEHYAAAFVVVMRAAGIPARVVTGYLGGERNPVDGYLEVRQSDAHAWTEIWLPQQGWQRIDPTAAIAPDRVEQSLANALPEGEQRPALFRPEFQWLRPWRFRYEAAVNSWNQWVLGYDSERQQSLLRRLGLPDPDAGTLVILLTAGGGVVMLILTAWALRQQRRLTPLQAAWQRFENTLQRRGHARQHWEGPRDYSQRLCLLYPHRVAEIRAICGLYERLQYARMQPVTRGDPELAQLRRLIHRFSP